MMKMKFFGMFFLMMATRVFAADGDYAVSKIPASLLKGAHVIKRMEEARLEIVSLSKVKMYQKYALTILDENGDDYAVLFEQYDKLSQVESIEGRLYDASGKKIRTLKKSEVQDRS